MSKGDVNLQLHKKINEIKVKTAEEMVTSVKTPEYLERPVEITERIQTDVAELADKKWIKRSMNRLVKKAAKVNSDLENLSFSANHLTVHKSANSAFVVENDNIFEDRISDKKKKEKKNNPASNLHQKEANAELLHANIDREHDLVNEYAKNVIPENTDLSADTYKDLSQFFVYKDMSKNSELSDLMLSGKNKKGEPCVDPKHVDEALLKMADQLMDIEISSIKLNSDHDIAENAAFLESIANRIAAFDRLSNEYDFLKKLDADKKEALTKQLDSLRDVSAYYILRKDIISDSAYIESEVGELSENASKASSKEQNNLSENMVIAIAIGKIIVKSGEVPQKNLKKLPVPTLKSKDASDGLKKTLKDFSKNDFSFMTEIIKDNYEKSDADKTNAPKTKDKKK